MKAHRVELLIVDHDGIGASEVKTIFENIKYPNHCMYPNVMDISTADIGAWTDEHPLNGGDTMRAEYDRVFKTREAK